MSKLNINDLLKQYGLAQKDLVECTGINKNTVSKYCNDTFENINKNHIDLLCKFFNCTPNDLFSVDDSVEVKTPTIILYDDETDYFEYSNEGIREVKRKLNDPNYKLKKDGMILPESSIIQEIHENNEPYITIPSLQEQEYISKEINKQLAEQLDKIKKDAKEEYKHYIKSLIEKSINDYIKSANEDYNKAIGLNLNKTNSFLENNDAFDLYKNHSISDNSFYDSNMLSEGIESVSSAIMNNDNFTNGDVPKIELKIKRNKKYINED